MSGSPVKSRDLRENILMDPSPCIVLATSGMMNAGPVVEYFKNWAHSKRNSLCFVGYQAEGTMGRRLQQGLSEVPMVINGQTEIVKVGCEMATIDGFSGHSDRRQLLEFVEQLNLAIVWMQNEAPTCFTCFPIAFSSFFHTRSSLADHSPIFKTISGEV